MAFSSVLARREFSWSISRSITRYRISLSPNHLPAELPEKHFLNPRLRVPEPPAWPTPFCAAVLPGSRRGGRAPFRLSPCIRQPKCKELDSRRPAKTSFLIVHHNIVNRSAAMAGDARRRFRRDRAIPRDYNTLCTEFDRSMGPYCGCRRVPSNGNEITRCPRMTCCNAATVVRRNKENCRWRSDFKTGRAGWGPGRAPTRRALP